MQASNVSDCHNEHRVTKEGVPNVPSTCSRIGEGSVIVTPQIPARAAMPSAKRRQESMVRSGTVCAVEAAETASGTQESVVIAARGARQEAAGRRQEAGGSRQQAAGSEEMDARKRMRPL